MSYREYTLAELDAISAHRPPGYEQAILAATRYLPDGRMLISDADNLRIGVEFTRTAIINRPSPDQIEAVLRHRRGGQLAEWIAAGRPILSWDQHARRLAVCNHCPDRHCASVCRETPYDRWVGSILRRGPGCSW